MGDGFCFWILFLELTSSISLYILWAHQNWSNQSEVVSSEYFFCSEYCNLQDYHLFIGSMCEVKILRTTAFHQEVPVYILCGSPLETFHECVRNAHGYWTPLGYEANYTTSTWTVLITYNCRRRLCASSVVMAATAFWFTTPVPKPDHIWHSSYTEIHNSSDPLYNTMLNLKQKSWGWIGRCIDLLMCCGIGTNMCTLHVAWCIGTQLDCCQLTCHLRMLWAQRVFT